MGNHLTALLNKQAWLLSVFHASHVPFSVSCVGCLDIIRFDKNLDKQKVMHNVILFGV